jgi:hypothetical protein
MNEDEKQQIIENIKQEVQKAGSARVGYHADQILKPNNAPVPYNIKSKIEATITASSKYISRPHPNFKNDFEIKLNPNYKEQKWHEKHPLLHDLLIAVIGAGLSLIVGYILWRIDNQTKNEERQELIQKIIDLNRRVDSLEKTYPNRLDTSIK